MHLLFATQLYFLPAVYMGDTEANSLVGPVFLRVFPVIRELLSCFPLLQRLLKAEAVVLAVLNHPEQLKTVELS